MNTKIGVVVVFAAAAACQSDSSPNAPTPVPVAQGAERQPCRAGSVCDPGLTCLSDRCVVVPNTVCPPVVEALASIELGNYAEPEVRAARIAQLKPMCEALTLSDSDAACIVAARTQAQLAQCPQPILAPPPPPPGLDAGIGSAGPLPTGLPPECGQYVVLLDQYANCQKLPADARKAIADVLVQLKQNWAQLGNTNQPQAVGDACKQGLAAMQQAMQQLGCP